MLGPMVLCVPQRATVGTAGLHTWWRSHSRDAESERTCLSNAPQVWGTGTQGTQWNLGWGKPRACGERGSGGQPICGEVRRLDKRGFPKPRQQCFPASLISLQLMRWGFQGKHHTVKESLYSCSQDDRTLGHMNRTRNINIWTIHRQY